MQLFGNFEILLFVRTILSNYIGHVSRMDSNRKEVRYVIKIPREVY